MSNAPSPPPEDSFVTRQQQNQKTDRENR